MNQPQTPDNEVENKNEEWIGDEHDIQSMLNDEVARLREENIKLRSMIERAMGPCSWKEYDSQYPTRLAPAPEEPVSECIKLLADDVLKLHKPDKEPEWRELGPDEVIQEGDQMTRIDTLMDWINVDWQFVHCGKKSKDLGMYLFRTRRPLPKQEEMPRDIDVLIDTIAFRGERKGEGVFFCIADSIRYLRDEIQKLKEAQ